MNYSETTRGKKDHRCTFPVLLLFILLFSLMNTLLARINDEILTSPIFLDSLFTIAAAMFFGPLPGMATGLLSNLIMDAFTGMGLGYLMFAPCNMATGLIIGVMSRRGMFETSLNLMTGVFAIALSNTLLGSLIGLIAFGGFTQSNLDHLTASLVDMGVPLAVAVLGSSFISNIIDKMISVYGAYLLYLVTGRYLGCVLKKLFGKRTED